MVIWSLINKKINSHETNCPIVFKSWQPHALMKLDIFQLDTLALSPPGAFKQNLIIQSQSKFWHARQINAHFYRADNFAPQNISIGVCQQIHAFDHVQKNFIFAVFYAFGAPRNGVCHCHRDARLNFQLVAFLGDVFLQDFAVGRLWKSKIEHFVEQLINDDEIVADRLLFELLEVLGEDLNDFVQHCEDERDVGVFLERWHDVEIVGFYVGECAFGRLDDGSCEAFFLCWFIEKIIKF